MKNRLQCSPFLFFSLIAIADFTYAQDPTSQHYRDTVVLPALGYGDTIPRQDRGGGWGALAISRPFQVFAVAVDSIDEQSARQEALEMCRNLGGKDCEPRMTFRNACFALASGGGHWGSASRSRQRNADKLALQNCRKFGGGSDCAIAYQTC